MEPLFQHLGAKCYERANLRHCARAHGRGIFVFLAGAPWRKTCTDQALNNDFIIIAELEITKAWENLALHTLSSSLAQRVRVRLVFAIRGLTTRPLPPTAHYLRRGDENDNTIAATTGMS